MSDRLTANTFLKKKQVALFVINQVACCMLLRTNSQIVVDWPNLVASEKVPVPGNMACLTGPAPAAGKHPRHGNVWGSDRSSR